MNYRSVTKGDLVVFNKVDLTNVKSCLMQLEKNSGETVRITIKTKGGVREHHH